jgi:hypothetical protein
MVQRISREVELYQFKGNSASCVPFFLMRKERQYFEYKKVKESFEELASTIS